MTSLFFLLSFFLLFNKPCKKVVNLKKTASLTLTFCFLRFYVTIFSNRKEIISCQNVSSKISWYCFISKVYSIYLHFLSTFVTFHDFFCFSDFFWSEFSTFVFQTPPYTIWPKSRSIVLYNLYKRSQTSRGLPGLLERKIPFQFRAGILCKI